MVLVDLLQLFLPQLLDAPALDGYDAAPQAADAKLKEQHESTGELVAVCHEKSIAGFAKLEHPRRDLRD